ncbi:MAG: glycosyltransferase family 2 protein [Cytophagales bacterium]|nr:glycosyltransferase family 2 protein [Cytophagales bacterium]
MESVSASSYPSVLPIVLGYGRFATTTALCLDTLLPQAHQANICVLAIDNGSPDESAMQLQQYKKNSAYQSNLKLHIHSKNLGFGGGMNESIKHALLLLSDNTPDWVILVNSDTLFPPHSLQRFLEALAIAPNYIGLVSPVTNNAGNAQKFVLPTTPADISPQTIQQDFEVWAYAASQLIAQPTKLLWQIQRADFFCVAIRTKLWQQLKGLDLIYGRGYYEDFDFSLRAQKVGYGCAMTEDCFIYHQGSASFKADTTQKKLIQTNKIIFQKRFPNAKILHLRQDNVLVLQDQLTWLAKQHELNLSTIQALQARIQLRWQEALKNMPRSPIKRWLWQRHLKGLHRSHHLLRSS